MAIKLLGTKILSYISLLALAIGVLALNAPVDRTHLTVIVSTDNKYGFINSKGRIAIEPVWDGAMEFDSSETAAVFREGSGWGAIDTNGDVVIEEKWTFPYLEEFNSHGLKTASKNGCYGFINKRGREVVPVVFDKVWKFAHMGLAPVRQNGLIGWVDYEGNTVIDPAWDKVAGSHANTFEYMGVLDDIGGFDSWGMALVERNGKYGWIDTRGTIAIKVEWDDAFPFRQKNLAIVSKNGRWGAIDREGGLAVPLNWDKAFESGSGLIGVTLNKKSGYVDQRGNTIIPLIWDDISGFDEDGLALIRADSLWGWINRKGKIEIQPNWVYAEPFDSSGTALVIENGKYGWIDRNGSYVIATEWDSAIGFDRFNETHNKHDGKKSAGLTKVRRNGRWGLINMSGDLVIPLEWGHRFEIVGGGLIATNQNIDGGRLYNITSGTDFGISGSLSSFDQNGRSYDFTRKRIGRFLNRLVDAQGKEMFSIPDGHWTPTIFQQDIAGFPRRYVEWRYFEEFWNRKPNLYAIKSIEGVIQERPLTERILDWMSFNTNNESRTRTTCLAYNADGDLIWSNLWIRYETKCWIVIAAASLLIILINRSRFPALKRPTQKRR